MSTDPSFQPLSPEEALRRHQEGDQSPEVLSVINHAAWAAFHAPWEVPALEVTVANEPIEPESAPADCNTIQPFHQEMLVAWMKKGGFSYFEHPTRGLLVDFRFGLKSDRAVQLRAWVSGKNRDILVVNLSSDRRVPPEDFVKALRLCNHWNKEYRWPRATVEQDYLDTDAHNDPPPPAEEVEAREFTHSGRLILDFQLPLEEGIHPKLLEDILDSVVSISWDFWHLARDKWGL